MIDQAEILISRFGRLGRVQLNRPKALNSLTLEMVRTLKDALKAFATDPEIVAILLTGEGDRGLCAGGDIRALYEAGQSNSDYCRNFWREEYELNAMIAAFPKPYVVVMDGFVMGGGVGVSAHGNCRIVTERTRIAMPETGIGFFPDVGATWLLSRSGGAGVYMALSGAEVSGSDAIHIGLADTSIASARIEELIDRLQTISTPQAIGQILLDLCCRLEVGNLELNRLSLDYASGSNSLEDTLVRLAGSSSAFAQAGAQQINLKSPTSLRVTYALLKRASTARCLEDCLVNEYRAACRLLDGLDLYEGIRAAIIDKDRSPKWRPATLEEVPQAMVAGILAGDGSRDPSFPIMRPTRRFAGFALGPAR